MKKYLILIVIIFLLTSCKQKTYTVTFIDNDKLISQITVKKNDNIKNIDNPEKEGYIFLNWQKNGIEYNKSNPITEDITLIATWVKEPTPPNMHTVTFDFGALKKTKTVDDGKTIEMPKEEPKKDKHEFIGWYYQDKLYDFSTPIYEDITLTAKFEKTRIKINYDLNGGTGTIEVEIDKGDIPKVPKVPIRFGYIFTYWTIDNKKYDFDTPLYEDTTIKANYEATVYVRVTFNTDGGNTIQSQMLVAGDTLKTLPTPEKVGYTFKYWSYQNAIFDINTKIEKDITLIAVYEQIEVTT